MKIRVQRTDGSTDTIELADSGWHLLHVADLNCLVGAGLTHSFTSDGFYYGTAETPAITYTEPGEEAVRQLPRPGATPHRHRAPAG
ncbi:MAG TPA: hypothetical protein VIJ73_13310 [Methylomirabilota bacterium]|jgi:hypothetical protein